MADDINHLIGFIESKLSELIQIYINERLKKGDGIIFIKGDKSNEKVDIGFLVMDMINPELKKQIDKLNYTKSKAYFFTFDVSNPNINSLIEKELDTT